MATQTYHGEFAAVKDRRTTYESPQEELFTFIESFRPEWHQRAACAGMVSSPDDPDPFFPGRGESARPAREVCQQCPVKRECLEAGLSAGYFFGIWGGTTERERRDIKRQRRQRRRMVS